MKIRVMTMDDYACVYELWLSCQGMGLNSKDDSPEGIRRFLLRNPETCFVAEDGSDLIGVILSGHDGRRGYIYHTAVSHRYRGQGIGRQLAEAALKALKDAGITKIALVVFERNEQGNAFWEKMGFTVRDDLVYRNNALADLIRIDT